MKRYLGFLSAHPFLTYVLMGALFIAFGITSIDLFFLLKANIRLYIEYGAMVIDDGALRQLAEIVAMAAISIACFIAFALCERILIKRLMANWMAARAQ